MKHLTYADKSMLVGDEAADVIVEYAASLASNRIGDSVTLTIYGTDGDKADATFLLDTGAPLMVETTHSDLPEPDNADAVEYMRRRIRQLAGSVAAAPEDQKMAASYDDLDLG